MALEMNNERFEVFKSQDQENGLFDVTFEVEEKLIHAHKFMLGSISTTFKSMFSTNWNKEETIKIKTNSFKEFYEFLTFIYSGNYNFNNENIFGMVDMAEAYQVKTLQQKCDQYLSEKEYSAENALEFLNNLSKYLNSLPLFVKTVLTAVKKHYPKILESETFIALPMEIVEKIVTFEDRFSTEELLFQKVYEWAKNQVNIKKQQKNEETFNVNNAIKAEITPFLPLFKFKKMNLSFLHNYVVKRGFLFSYDKLSEILEFVYPYHFLHGESIQRLKYKDIIGVTVMTVKVKVTDSLGRSIFGFLPRDSEAVGVIPSLKDCYECDYSSFVWWKTKCRIPSTPSLLKKRDGVEWYVCYFDDGRIGVIHQSQINDSHYLLAEMNIGISGFKPDSKCKIEIE